MMLECMLWISLTSVLATGSAEAQPSAKNVVLLTLPKLDWALEIGGAELIVEQKEVAPDGKSVRFLAVDWTTGILISAFLEDQGKPATAEQCRGFYWAKAKESPLKKDHIVQSKFGNMALVEFFVKEHEGVKTNQKHVNAYLTKGNFWIDVHLSKLYFKEGERELFNTILRSVKLTPKTSAQKVRANYRTTNQMVLRLDIPAAWPDEIAPGSGETPPEIGMIPPPDGSSKVLITVLSNENDSEVSKLTLEMVGNAQAVTDRPRKASTP